jgi:hypothetical protein
MQVAISTQAAPRGPSFAERVQAFIKACFTGPLNTLITLACLAVLYGVKKGEQK